MDCPGAPGGKVGFLKVELLRVLCRLAEGVMTLPRRRFLHLVAGAAALPAVSRFAWAQAYPTRPITMVVPYPPGGAADTIGRIVVEKMRQSLGQPIIIENVGRGEHWYWPRGSRPTGRLYGLSRSHGHTCAQWRVLFANI
jgi:hypothetical protein